MPLSSQPSSKTKKFNPASTMKNSKKKSFKFPLDLFEQNKPLVSTCHTTTTTTNTINIRSSSCHENAPVVPCNPVRTTIRNHQEAEEEEVNMFTSFLPYGDQDLERDLKSIFFDSEQEEQNSLEPLWNPQENNTQNHCFTPETNFMSSNFGNSSREDDELSAFLRSWTTTEGLQEQRGESQDDSSDREDNSKRQLHPSDDDDSLELLSECSDSPSADHSFDLVDTASEVLELL